MSSLNISLKKEAYEFLKSLKSSEKSFSDVILEFREKKGKKDGKSILKYAGALKGIDIDWRAKEERMKEFRDSFNKRIEETRKKMGKVRHDRHG